MDYHDWDDFFRAGHANQNPKNLTHPTNPSSEKKSLIKKETPYGISFQLLIFIGIGRINKL
jgi:hypothetical protein